MKVTIDSRLLKDRNISGTERYIYELIKNSNSVLNNDIEIECLIQSSFKLKDDFENIKCISHLMSMNNNSIFHRPYGIENDSSLIEFILQNKTILTVLDLIKCEYPDYFISKKHHYNYIKMFEFSIKIADKIIAISNYTKKALIEKFNIPENKIEVIYLGVDNKKFFKLEQKAINEYKTKKKLPEKFILFIGHDYPHKNLKNLLIAFQTLVNDPLFNEYYLVICGNFFYPHGQSYLKKNLTKVKKRIIKLGYLPDEEICSLYNAAELFVFPSLHEGFGFPILEALSCGTPVACSSLTSIPEVGGCCVQYFDAYNPNDIANKIKEIISNKELKIDNIQSGYKWVKEFRWEYCIQKTFEVYKKVDNEINLTQQQSILKEYLKHLLATDKIKKESIIRNIKDIRILFKMFYQSLKNIGLKKTIRRIFKNIKNS